MKAAIRYEIVMLVEHTLNIIRNPPKKLWSVFTSSGTKVVGARQYSFEFTFSPRIGTTLICMGLYIMSFIIYGLWTVNVWKDTWWDTWGHGLCIYGFRWLVYLHTCRASDGGRLSPALHPIPSPQQSACSIRISSVSNLYPTGFKRRPKLCKRRASRRYRC